MRNRTWIGIGWACAMISLAVNGADTTNKPATIPAPPPATLEAPPPPALETPSEQPSPLVVPTNLSPTAPTAVPIPSLSPPPSAQQPAPAVNQRTKAAQPPAASPTPAQAQAAAPATTVTVPLSGSGIIKEDRVNVRSRPVPTGEVVAQFNKGDHVDILGAVQVVSAKPGEPAEWLKVGLPKTNFVWLSSKFVDSASKTVSASRLNVRAGPGEAYGVLGRIDKGAPIREVETQGEWLKIPAPEGSYAFVASFLVDRGQSTPELAHAAPAKTATAETTAELTPTAAAEPAPAVAATPETQAEVTPDPDTVSTKFVKRVVSREGIVRRTVSIQAPTEFALENAETRKTVNYLYPPDRNDLVLRNFEGQRILVTGEELLDERWPNTPLINIEKLRARP